MPVAVTTPATVNKDGQHSCDGASAAGALEAATNGNWAGDYAVYGGKGNYTPTTVLGETHAFALLCGDVSAPVTFGVNRFGWAPTVQLTAYLRGIPVERMRWEPLSNGCILRSPADWPHRVASPGPDEPDPDEPSPDERE